jgi:hypothetical protein
MNAVVSASFVGVPVVVFDHVDQLDYELSLLILLGGLECVFVFPANCCLATLTEYVSYFVESSQ